MPGAAADVILVEDLLVACAAEAGRIARAAERLDASFGAMLSRLAADADAATGALAQDLQDTDRIRQELAGLARALDLAVTAGSLSAPLAAAQVRACTPLGHLQERLLSGRGGGMPSGGSPP